MSTFSTETPGAVQVAAPQQSPVALDAMGGDRAPAVMVEGAIEACRAGLGPIILVGDETRIQRELERFDVTDLPLEVVHASEVVGMAEHPGRAARGKRDSSLHVGFQLVKSKRACALVSAGNTGAAMAVGLLVLRRIRGCNRPAIASELPSVGKPTVLLDMGANVDCRASHLVQFALMGAVYAEHMLGEPRPTVGLLSNGTEPTKGTETLREAHRLLTQTDLRYLGYVEGDQVPLGVADVVVTDGFVGNVALKIAEGVATAVFKRGEALVKGDWLGALGLRLARRLLRTLKAELDWANVGGAPLLGLDGIGVVAHGGSSPRAIRNAIKTARTLHEVGIVAHIKARIESDGTPFSGGQTSTAELPMTRTSAEHEVI